MCMTLSACSSKETDDTEELKEVQTVTDSTEEETKESTSSGFPKAMPEFSTIDLQGNVAANNVFSQADLTVVNFWATYCSPCISELPELGEWAEEMPDNVQFALRDLLSVTSGFTCNFLVLDEAFDNLDAQGTSSLVNLVTSEFSDVESVFIVTHHSQISIPYDKEICIVKNSSGVSSVEG